MKITVFGSSSKGNCTLVEFNNHARVYFDAGIPTDKIKTKKSGAFVCISHNHSDHSSQVSNWINKYQATIICTKGTMDALDIQRRNVTIPKMVQQLTKRTYDLYKAQAQKEADGLFHVLALPTLHDAPDPCAFIVFAGKEIFAYITDTGKIPETNGCIFDAVMIEANYTPKILEKNLSRDDAVGYVAGRVGSGFGHLGLHQVIEWSEPILKYRPLILLSHRSTINFDEQEYTESPELFKKHSRLVENGKTYDSDILKGD